MAAEVQHPVDRGLADVARLRGADDDVAELPRAGALALVDREREHVGRLVAAAVLTIQLADVLLADELDREVAITDAGGRECGGGVCPQLGRHVLELEPPAQASSSRSRSE